MPDGFTPTLIIQVSSFVQKKKYVIDPYTTKYHE